ncbi:MAG: SpoIIE family protein phosphatase, partial [Atopobiaceae bacterium]|nr:SpoIIE family protein phosphatase [Atopobiaceae bacterium]
LCLQLQSLGERTEAFKQVVSSMGTDSQKVESVSPKEYRLLTDPVGDVLEGYTLSGTGTVAIVSDNVVVASDDERVPVGSDVRELLGEEVLAAVDASLQDNSMQVIPYKGVFDEPGGEGAYGAEDDEAYLLSGQQGDYTVMIIEPVSMVFRNRGAIMGRETFASLIILTVLGAIVDRLLDLLVAQRIDKTNDALVRITSGHLDARVEEEGTREFKSLAAGINLTVDALQGWIAEAESRLDSELAAARTIQESALPRTFPAFPDIPRFDIFAIMDPAREVGGDFYDFFLVGDSGPDAGKLLFLVADVSGKGIPAALFMMKAAAKVRSEQENGTDLAQSVKAVNRELVEGNDSCMFVTMWVGVLDYATGHLVYVNAGHNPPLFWHEGAGWQWLKDKSGLPLGLHTAGRYQAYSLDFQKGDKIIVYSDGVTEAMNVDRHLYGEERLEATLNASCNEHPEAIVKAVRSSVASFAQDAEQSDDITILSLELG